MYLLLVEETEVLSTIIKLKLKQPTDFHGMSFYHFKKLTNTIVKPLTVPVNNSFDNGIFPDALN